jgi:hypothetical protein
VGEEGPADGQVVVADVVCVRAADEQHGTVPLRRRGGGRRRRRVWKLAQVGDCLGQNVERDAEVDNFGAAGRLGGDCVCEEELACGDELRRESSE